MGRVYEVDGMLQIFKSETNTGRISTEWSRSSIWTERGRCVMRPAPGLRPFPPPILYIELFPQERDFRGRLLKLRPKPPPTGCTATSIGQGDPGQRDGLQDARFDVLGPLLGQPDRRGSCHSWLRLKKWRSQA